MRSHGLGRYGSPRHSVFCSPDTFHYCHDNAVPDVLCIRLPLDIVYDNVTLRCVASVLSQRVQNTGPFFIWLFEILDSALTFCQNRKKTCTVNYDTQLKQRINQNVMLLFIQHNHNPHHDHYQSIICLLYTSDAADE